MPQAIKTYQLKANENLFTLSDTDVEAIDFIKKSPTHFHLIKESLSVHAHILEADVASKTVTVEVNGETFHVSIKDPLDQMLDQMGFNAAAAKQIKEIKAPMPGLVLEINVQQGQTVEEGDKILILEAMKMENSINIATCATIKKINVKKGQAVEKGQVLVELE